MDLEQGIASLTFRWPLSRLRIPLWLHLWLRRHPRASAILEGIAVRRNDSWDEAYRTVCTLADVPRMSTVMFGMILAEAVRQMPPGSAYLNVGVWHGFSLLAGMAGNPDRPCIGVDNFSEFGGPREEFLRRFERMRSPCHQFFDEDAEAYFRHHTSPISVYFYDGHHGYESQKQGLALAHPFLVPGALVFIDDTNWDAPRQATLAFLSEHPDDYRIIADIRTPSNGHPTLWNGVMVLRKR